MAHNIAMMCVVFFAGTAFGKIINEPSKSVDYFNGREDGLSYCQKMAEGGE